MNTACHHGRSHSGTGSQTRVENATRYSVTTPQNAKLIKLSTPKAVNLCTITFKLFSVVVSRFSTRWPQFILA